jgi:hypothetical protein
MRKNSTLAREVELALPSLLEPTNRQHIADRNHGAGGPGPAETGA